MAEPMRIGFLGAGHIATYHSKSIRRAATELPFPIVRAGVFDPDTERRDDFAAASGHRPMNSVEDVLSTCDVVYVCTWTSEHLSLVEAAVRHGCAVFCEKPLGRDLSEARAVRDALAGTINQVGLVLRHSPAYLMAARLTNDPRAGRVMSVVLRDDQFIPIQGHYGSSWRRDVTKSGAGTLLEHSIHDVDALHAIVGPIDSVSARSSNFHGFDGIEDVVAANFTFVSPDDAASHGVLSSIWHDNLARPSLRRIEVFCENRFVAIEGDDWLGPVVWVDSDGTSGSLAGAELVTATRSMAHGHPNPDAAFLLAVHRHERAFPDAETALTAHLVVDAMYRSAAADGDPVRVGSPRVRVERVGSEDVKPLRLDVLRRGMTNRTIDFDGDDDSETVHLAAFDEAGAIIGVSTWMRRESVDHPGRRAVQLRGMATARHRQGAGVGAELLLAGFAAARATGAEVVWANARDAALDFYRRHGMREVGEGFIESVTGLPHHRVVIELG